MDQKLQIPKNENDQTSIIAEITHPNRSKKNNVKECQHPTLFPSKPKVQLKKTCNKHQIPFVGQRLTLVAPKTGLKTIETTNKNTHLPTKPSGPSPH